MHWRKPLVALVAIAVLMTVAVGPVAAHETQRIEGYDVTFGGADEPLITDERMWLEFEIVDNETGEPVDGQAETLNVSVDASGSEKTPLEVSEKHGEPGVYEAQVIFTEPGEYVVHLEGSLEGTEVHTHFETEVHDHAELEYPGDESRTGDADNDSATETDDRSDESGLGSVSVAVAAVGFVAAVGAYWSRRC